jgi:predicted nucleic acid-binding protein
MEEIFRVLAYPKFGLTENEILDLVEGELLPYVEPVIGTGKSSVSCPDPDDEKFLSCAERAKADALVSGDAHLLRLKRFWGCPILTMEIFLKRLKD